MFLLYYNLVSIDSCTIIRNFMIGLNPLTITFPIVVSIDVALSILDSINNFSNMYISNINLALGGEVVTGHIRIRVRDIYSSFHLDDPCCTLLLLMSWSLLLTINFFGK